MASSSCKCRLESGTQFAPASHRGAAASLLDWSEIPDGSGAKQGEREAAAFGWQAARASAGQPDRPPQFAPASHRRAAASLLEWSAISDGSSAKQRERKAAAFGRQAPKSSRKLARLVGWQAISRFKTQWQLDRPLSHSHCTVTMFPGRPRRRPDTIQRCHALPVERRQH